MINKQHLLRISPSDPSHLQIRFIIFLRVEQEQFSSNVALFKRPVMETSCHMGQQMAGWCSYPTMDTHGSDRARTELVSSNSRYLKYKSLCQRLVTPTLSLHSKERVQHLQTMILLICCDDQIRAGEFYLCRPVARHLRAKNTYYIGCRDSVFWPNDTVISLEKASQ